MAIELATRNADLVALRDMLMEQDTQKVDIVAPSTKIRAEGGLIRVVGVEPVLGDEGVTMADGVYRPTAIFDEGIADKLGMPLTYVRRMRADRPDLWDANVNGWLHGRRTKTRLVNGEMQMLSEGVSPDERSFLIRAFRDGAGENGIARAFLSDRYSVMDNLDALTAALDGVRQAGAAVEIEGCDLTDRRMYVRIKSPEVSALAPTLLKNYRSPFSGDSGADNPTVFGGFVISNSETGDGAFTIVPRLLVEVCANGLTIQKDAMREVHLGGRMEEGIVRWSADTERKMLDLITARARDAVSTFLDVDYVTRAIEEIEAKAERKIEKPEEDVKTVTRRLMFDQAQQDAVFGMFIQGGDLTAGGVMSAVTAAARDTDDADKAHGMEAVALRALDLAASL